MALLVAGICLAGLLTTPAHAFLTGSAGGPGDKGAYSNQSPSPSPSADQSENQRKRSWKESLGLCRGSSCGMKHWNGPWSSTGRTPSGGQSHNSKQAAQESNGGSNF